MIMNPEGSKISVMMRFLLLKYEFFLLVKTATKLFQKEVSSLLSAREKGSKFLSSESVACFSVS